MIPPLIVQLLLLVFVHICVQSLNNSAYADSISEVYYESAELKGLFTQKITFCHHLLTVVSFQTRMSFFLMLNIKEDI